ncbi:MAG: Fe-S-binding domain-containing protein, partial [Flavisolibacter sp.]|nr:Fe-S-binding domain-containing protein [Flavisolibacter sp.]
RPMPKLVASCRTNVMDGMVVENITNPAVLEARKGVVEFLLINHPLDCPVCDQAGECDLQDLSYQHGAEATRYEFKRRTFERIDIGPYIQLHMTRCILCYRCVYTANQVTGQREHGVLDRGDHSQIATYIQESLDSEFIGNVIDVCPVGALTDRTFRFKNRVWFTKPMDAHRDCATCKGKVRLWLRGDDVLRVTARKDQWGEVEDWICNECRFEKKKVSDWVIEGPTMVDRHSVISAGHYTNAKKPKEFFSAIMDGRKPKLLLDIHTISDVNTVDLNEIPGPATSKTFNGDPHATGVNVTDMKQGKGRNLAGTDSTNPNTP